MSIENIKLEKLQCTFLKLTEANQHYMLGLAEGLKQAQKGNSPNGQQEVKANSWKKLAGME